MGHRRSNCGTLFALYSSNNYYTEKVLFDNSGSMGAQVFKE